MSVFPKEVEFKLEQGERKCVTFVTFSEEDVLAVESRWSDSYSKDLKRYTRTAEEEGVEVDLPNEISEGSENVRICFKIADNFGYSGIILFKSVKYGAGVGAWVRINGNKEMKIIEISQDESDIFNKASEDIKNTIALTRKSEGKDDLFIWLIAGLVLDFVLISSLVGIFIKKRRELYTEI